MSRSGTARACQTQHARPAMSLRGVTSESRVPQEPACHVVMLVAGGGGGGMSCQEGLAWRAETRWHEIATSPHCSFSLDARACAARAMTRARTSSERSTGRPCGMAGPGLGLVAKGRWWRRWVVRPRWARVCLCVWCA